MNLKISIEFYSKADTDQCHELIKTFVQDHNDILPEIDAEYHSIRFCVLIVKKWHETPQAFKNAFNQFLGDILTSYICTIQSGYREDPT